MNKNESFDTTVKNNLLYINEKSAVFLVYYFFNCKYMKLIQNIENEFDENL